jgi:hypothetical protein
MFDKCLHHEGHTRRFLIAESGGAWEVRTEEDSRLVKHLRYDDWHRVERALMTMRLEVSTLEEAGWVVV